MAFGQAMDQHGMRKAFGGIDAGGTKWACAIGTSPDDIIASCVIPTTSVAETLAKVTAFFQGWIAQGNQLEALGVSSFGPLVRDVSAPDWGCITETPKPGWSHAVIGPALRAQLNIPIAFDTDVNGSALAEGEWGMAQGLQHFAYVTIGTGIGGALVSNGALINGTAHPEIGHIKPRRRAGDSFAGCCPFHGDCYEGLASGTALRARTGMASEDLPQDHPAWDETAYYLGSLCAAIILMSAPQRIILGGSLMQQAHLLDKVRAQASGEILPYLASRLTGRMSDMIVASRWVTPDRAAHFNSGIGGGFILARNALLAARQ